MKTKLILTLMIACFYTASTMNGQDIDQPKFELSNIQQFIQKSSVQQNNVLKSTTAEQAYKPLEVDLHFWMDSVWTPESRTQFNYEGNKLVNITTRGWDGTSWYEDERYSYTYENGRMTEEIYEDYDFESSDYLPIERYSYSYDASNTSDIMNESIYSTWSGDSWTPEERDVYTIVNNRIEGAIYYTWNGIDWEATEQYRLIETEDTVFVSTQTWDGLSWINSEREIYLNVTIDELFEFMFELAELYNMSFIQLHLMDMPDVIYEYWDGGTWIPDYSQIQINTFDTITGELISRDFNVSSWDGSEWVTETTLRFYLNGHTQPDSSAFFIHDSEESGEIFISKEIYSYNNLGLLREAVIYSNNGVFIEKFYKFSFKWDSEPTSVEKNEKISDFKLNNAYPNPFNPSTNISYSLASATDISLTAYDLLGRKVATLFSGHQSAGLHTAQFNALGLSSGPYIIRLEATGFNQTRMVTLIK